MSKDLGSVPAGFDHNFAYQTLVLDNHTYVRLVDQSDNATESEQEALYINSLVVPAGSTLDLNGFHAYARLGQIAGAVVGGSVSRLPDSGPIILDSTTFGSISTAGELDESTSLAEVVAQ